MSTETLKQKLHDEFDKWDNDKSDDISFHESIDKIFEEDLEV